MDKKKKAVILVPIVMAAVIILGIFCLYRNLTKEHEYYCDGFLLTVDDRVIDLQERDESITFVVELLPITRNDLAIICRVDENQNKLMVYNFRKKDFIFEEYGIQMAWVQDSYDTLMYLKEDIVYNKDKEQVFEAPVGSHVLLIEYVDTDFKATLTDENYENPTEIWID